MAKKGAVNLNKPREEDERPIRWRRYQYLFLIVCEDGNTEPYYFRTFETQIPAETLYMKSVGTGLSSKGVVERAIVERENLKVVSKKDVDETWVVFDKDDSDKVLANTNVLTKLLS